MQHIYCTIYYIMLYNLASKKINKIVIITVLQYLPMVLYRYIIYDGVLFYNYYIIIVAVSRSRIHNAAIDLLKSACEGCLAVESYFDPHNTTI